MVGKQFCSGQVDTFLAFNREELMCRFAEPHDLQVGVEMLDTGGIITAEHSSLVSEVILTLLGSRSSSNCRNKFCPGPPPSPARHNQHNYVTAAWRLHLPPPPSQHHGDKEYMEKYKEKIVSSIRQSRQCAPVSVLCCAHNDIHLVVVYLLL